MRGFFYLAITLLIASCNQKSGSDLVQENPKQVSMKFDSGYSDVNGIKMYYEIHGSGEPLVLIHGGGSTINTTFGRILPLFAARFKVIAMDLQAHGRSGDRNAPESFQQDADDVAMLLKNLGIGKANILGFSNGGSTAIQIYNRHPEVVNKLIIASAIYKREGMLPGFFDGIKDATIDKMPKELKEEFMRVNPDSARFRNMFNKDKERMLNFTDWSDDVLTSIKVPTLIICGDKDVVIPEHAVAMSRLIPDSRLILLPALHGEYLGAAEVPINDTSLVQLTANAISHFISVK